MPVVVEFADGEHGNALQDLNSCHEGADATDSAALDHLLYDYVAETLPSMSRRALEAYLRSRVWRVEQGHAVIKSAGPPYVAYAVIDRQGTPVILVLGFCIAYPGSEELWWTQVLRPRLTEHL